MEKLYVSNKVAVAGLISQTRRWTTRYQEWCRSTDGSKDFHKSVRSERVSVNVLTC